jgi:hypothetical protein
VHPDSSEAVGRYGIDIEVSVYPLGGGK